MQSLLTIRNFGPVKDATLDLRDINVFIGPQASGKSTIAKLYTICKSPLAFLKKPAPVALLLADDGDLHDNDAHNFKKALEEYNIRSFLRPDSEVIFTSEMHDFSYKNDKVIYDRKIFKKIIAFGELIKDVEKNKDEIAAAIQAFYYSFIQFGIFLKKSLNVNEDTDTEEITSKISNNQITASDLSNLFTSLSEIELALSNQAAKYIPAERNFIPIIKNAALSLQHENVPIPKHILAFGAEVEKATFELNELDLGFIQPGTRYVFENGMDMIYFGKDQFIRLTEAASGFQTLVPLLLPIMAKRKEKFWTHQSFVIEEPELNLFPKAQYELLKKLSSTRTPTIEGIADFGQIHTYTTHSPFVLAAFNNMMYADNVRLAMVNKYVTREKMLESAGKAYAQVSKIIPAPMQQKKFSAYQIADGTATSILNRETGLIEDNYLDNVSNEMSDDFEALMELMPNNER
jgi:AAA ATPase domain